MALKGDRQLIFGDISHFMNSTGERGGVVSHGASGPASGVSMDQAGNTVSYAANPSGIRPAGLLVQDVVNKDLTQTHINFFKDEVQLGGKVFVVNVGEFTTNMIYPGHSPSPGAKAYVGHSGLLATSDVATDASDSTGSTRLVGRWQSSKDEDGYAKIKINLP